MDTIANSEDPDEMKAGISSGSALFAKTKLTFRERNEIYFVNYNLQPFNINIGPS